MTVIFNLLELPIIQIFFLPNFCVHSDILENLRACLGLVFYLALGSIF